MIKKLLILLIIPLCGFSFKISIDDLLLKPQGRARDYFSLVHLEESNISQENAKKLFYSTQNPKLSHVKEFANITIDDGIKNIIECKKLKANEITYELSPECISMALSIKEASKISKTERLILSKKLLKYDPLMSEILFYLGNEDLFKKADPEISLKIFNNIRNNYKKNNLDQILDQESILKLQENSKINIFIEKIAINIDLNNLSKSILQVDEKKLNFSGSFYLGIISLKEDNKQKATLAFTQSLNTSFSQKYKDRATFWLWKSSNNKKYFEDLLNSDSINIYTIYAREVAKKEFFTLLTKADDINESTELTVEKLTDPFYWADLLDRKHSLTTDGKYDLLKELGGKRAEPLRSSIYRSIDYKKYSHFFLLPWVEILKQNTKISDIALILSLGRQESYFIPAALSTSYAIGSMQMMPFVIDAMVDQRDDEYEPYDFFDDRLQLPYARLHIKWLQSKVAHPLFVSYAYNGGLGFTTRNVLNKLFKNEKYDPFISMELVAYEETREYGKAVLANYIVYKKILNEPISLLDLLDNLKQ